ncbi:TolC family protein [Alcanivorax sp. HI0083]|nr:TolC family protein [Alcanivorax sp. HI0083]
MNRISIFFTRKKPRIDRFFAPLILLGVLAFASPLEAAEAELTFTQAIKRSLEQHPQIKALAYRTQAARAQIRQAEIRRGTEIQLEVEDVLGSGIYEGADSAQATLSLSWALEGKQVESRVDVAEGKQSVAVIEQDLLRYDVAARTAQAFLTALAYQERLALAKLASDNALTSLDELRRRSRAGRASRVDLLRAEVELERRKLDVEDLDHELLVARQHLAAQWGAANDVGFALLGELQTSQQLVSLEDLEKQLQQSPRVTRFLTQARVNESEMAMAKADALSRWRFSAGVRRYEATDDFGVVAGIAIPLGNQRRNQARISELAAEKSLNEAMAISEESRLQARLFELYQALQHSRHQAAALREEMIPRLRQAVSAANEAFSLGRFSYLEWISVKQELLDARLALINTQLASHVSLTEIERLTGLALYVKSVSAQSKEQK